ncbi:TraR/DksA family transcriptional regulator [Citrobacter sp. wls619]|uniref:TraR/DksA C4-type zinc finger protein n=1 Tax=Citrobacter sp. wls619 TaxID=2576432 RepID=UPI0010C9D160|nr:TraR/DksA C4-type zinc finger protein [Citrobacter sp. wls619]TKV11703.1 TraR/DksA family transcriptional regulator [Citrobacter sp. wls619]
MADEIDRDQVFNERTLESQIASARLKKTAHPSLCYCRLCGEDIPEKRRQSVPGVSLCTDCQEIADRRRKRQ